MRVRVPQEDGCIREVPFARVTVAELRRAMAAEREAEAPKRRKATLTAERRKELTTELSAAMNVAVGRGMSAHADAAVKVRDGVGGGGGDDPAGDGEEVPKG